MPIERIHFTTRSHDEAVDFIRQTLFNGQLRSRDTRSGGEFTASVVRVGPFMKVTSARCTFGFALTASPVDHLIANHLHTGEVQLTDGRDDNRFAAGDVFLGRPTAMATMTSSGFELQGLQLPLRVVEELAAMHAGIDPADLRFESARAVSPALARYWRAMLAHVVQQLNAPGSALANPLVTEHTQRLVAAAVLAVFPNTTMTNAYQTPAGTVAPAAVRRAIAYIDDHADQPIRLTDIANAAGTRPRALQYAFRRHYDTTPLAYLTTVRLERAHRDLQTADPNNGATVNAIARSWGFTNPSRFSAAYRTTYHQPPATPCAPETR